MDSRNQKVLLTIVISIIIIIINICIIFRLIIYENYFNDEIASSVGEMKDTAERAEIVLSKVIYDKRIDERQYRSLYYDYMDLKMEFYKLQEFAYLFEHKENVFSKGKPIFNIADYFGNFGYEKGLRKNKELDEELRIVDLMEDDLKKFKLIYRLTGFYNQILIDGVDKVKGRSTAYSVRNGKWVIILEKIDECSKDISDQETLMEFLTGRF